MKTKKKKRYRGMNEWMYGKDWHTDCARDEWVKTTAEKLNSLRAEKFERQRHWIATQPTVVRNDDTSVVMSECSCRASSDDLPLQVRQTFRATSRSLGFTLVELVIVIAIVIVLSVVSVPIYRSYVDKAKYSEGYALLGTIISAQKAYYSEYGNFYNDGGRFTTFEPVLGIDVRGNKYFTLFYDGAFGNGTSYWARAWKPEDLMDNGLRRLGVNYNITSGAKFVENNN